MRPARPPARAASCLLERGRGVGEKDREHLHRSAADGAAPRLELRLTPADVGGDEAAVLGDGDERIDADGRRVRRRVLAISAPVVASHANAGEHGVRALPRVPAAGQH
jgi:hypothetical protein